MKHVNLEPYLALLLLVSLFSACSGSAENSGATNGSAAEQANNNSAPQSQVAEGTSPAGAASTAPPTVQPIPIPPPVVAKPAANSNANAATVETPGNARAAKLVVPAKKINYGKVPQEKTLVRAIVIKNGGLADLNIESVVPS